MGRVDGRAGVRDATPPAMRTQTWTGTSNPVMCRGASGPAMWGRSPMHSFDDFHGIVTADEPMAPHIWFRLGGPAAFLARPQTPAQMLELIRRCRAEQVPFKILAGGSNVLVRDEGIRAVVIHMESP